MVRALRVPGGRDTEGRCCGKMRVCLASAGRSRRTRPSSGRLPAGLARHLSAEADSMARASSALHDAMKLRELVASAGVRNVNVRPTVKTTKLPLPAEFVPGHLAALPMAQEIARLSAEWRNAFVEDMTEALSAHVDSGQLILPAGVHVVTADA